MDLELYQGGQNFGPCPVRNGVPSRKRPLKAMSFGGASALETYNKLPSL